MHQLELEVVLVKVMKLGMHEGNSSQYDREFEFESYEDWVEAMNYGLSSEEYYAWYDSTNQWAEGDDHWVEGNGY